MITIVSMAISPATCNAGASSAGWKIHCLAPLGVHSTFVPDSDSKKMTSGFDKSSALLTVVRGVYIVFFLLLYLPRGESWDQCVSLVLQWVWHGKQHLEGLLIEGLCPYACSGETLLRGCLELYWKGHVQYNHFNWDANPSLPQSLLPFCPENVVAALDSGGLYWCPCTHRSCLQGPGKYEPLLRRYWKLLAV